MYDAGVLEGLQTSGVLSVPYEVPPLFTSEWVEEYEEEDGVYIEEYRFQNVAAGAKIPRENKDEFIEMLEEEITQEV